ncbi:hypothetical protein [Dyella flagellata]|uniref:Uncharacterized protein n=1 Tax=Dyella flagellata TaxID=1867833 RepID=A0ABQ5X7L2_9GAMM|nr:hypothetical protein [Dyella flagellata]GLQ87152.1 hypothetical protein GCM10007898_07180 [Dyella flagellata]
MRKPQFLCLLVAGGLTTFSLATCISNSLYHPLNGLALVLALLPWLPIVLKLYFKPKRYFKYSQRNRPEENDGIVLGTLLAVFFEIVCLLLLASWRAGLVHDNEVLVPGAMVGFLWLLGMYVAFLRGNAAERESLSIKTWLSFLVLFGTFGVCYGGSALGLANRLWDRGAPDIYHSQITGKHTTSGRGGMRYYLELSGGPDPGGSDLQVSNTQYVAAQTGNLVCMAVYPGALGFKWMESVSCPDQASP